jgi:hypothetical protein
VARIVVCDACVLYPAPLRDLLMRLATTGLFQARWTDRIHDEWTRNLAANRPDLAPSSLDRCRRLMDAHVPDCLVTGYEGHIPTLTLPDADDRHVLAAAIHAGAEAIVTFNLIDFPAAILGTFDVEAVHPDAFVVDLWEGDPDAVIEAARKQRAGLKNPPVSANDYLATLERCRLPQAAARLREAADRICFPGALAMPAFLVVACLLLSIPALVVGVLGYPESLIAGAILLGSATIATAIPEAEGARKGPGSLD